MRQKLVGQGGTSAPPRQARPFDLRRSDTRRDGNSAAEGLAKDLSGASPRFGARRISSAPSTGSHPAAGEESSVSPGSVRAVATRSPSRGEFETRRRSSPL